MPLKIFINTLGMSASTVLRAWVEEISVGSDTRANVVCFLEKNRCATTAVHSIQVGTEARRIADLYGLNPHSAEVAGWLHDISAVIPSERRVELADQLGIEVLAEERAYPMIVHQKLSIVIAQELFKIENSEILSAIGCHTTLKPGATSLDKAVFVADKIKWDQAGKPPYLDAIHRALEISLDAASHCYLAYLFGNKAQLKVIHPWAWAAYRELDGA